MCNALYDEPLTAAIEPVIDSYEHGTGFEDMKLFAESFLRGADPHKEERVKAFRENIPYFDGRCGERIRDHIVDTLYEENRDETEEQIKQLRTGVAQLNQKLDILLEQKAAADAEPPLEKE